MVIDTPHVVNEDFQPSENQEAVLDVLKDERRANPKLIRESTGLKRQRVNDALRSLNAAGWIRQVTRGLYEFHSDPRTEESSGEAPDGAAAPAEDLEVLQDKLDGLDAEAAALRDENERLREQLESAREIDVDRVRNGVGAALTALEGQDPDVAMAQSELESVLEVIGDE